MLSLASMPSLLVSSSRQEASRYMQETTVTVEDSQFEQQTEDWVMGTLIVDVEHDDADGCETAVTIAIEGGLLICSTVVGCTASQAKACVLH